MNPKKRHFTVLTSLLLFVNLLWGQNENIRFKHLTVDDGLSQGWIHCICQDQYGFIWIGTDNGLNRYDGYNFVVYKHNPKNNKTINSGDIRSLYEDRKGKLWVGTSQGLNFYDRQNDQFIRITKGREAAVSAIAEDEKNNLWIGSHIFLYYYNIKTDSLTVYSKSLTYTDSISDNMINTVFIDRKKNVWIGTANGLNLYDKTTKSFIKYYHNENNPQSLSSNRINTIFEDNAGRLWIGTEKGLDLFTNAKDRPSDGVFIHYQHDDKKTNSIANGTILSLLEDKNHNLWIGIENGGLDKLSLNNFNENSCYFSHFQNDPYKTNSISSNSIYTLFQDKQNNIWIGTFDKGINTYSKTANRFYHVMYEPDNKNLLSNNHVNAFLEENDFIWIGTEGGLNQYNKKEGTFKHFVHNSLDKTSISSNAIWAIYKDKRGNLWIGTWGGGLNLFDYKTNTFKHYCNDSKNTKSLKNNNIYAILEDKHGNFWLGTMGSGLNLFDRNKKTAQYYMQPNTGISSDYITTIVEKDDDLWLASVNSLERFNPISKSFKHYIHNPKDSKSISSNKIYSIFKDSKGNLWVGTDIGLNLYDKLTDKFRWYQIEDGLPDNSIKSILEDDHGNLWLGTNKGISKFINAINYPIKSKYKNYTLEDGLQGNEFNRRSCLKGADGLMYFGGVNGFNIFHPDSIKDNPYIPNIIITDFLLFNKSVEIGTKDSPLKQHISITKELVLTYNQSVFSFKFVALNYVVPEKNQYAYIMEGFENRWNCVGNKREATYTNLNPGEYIFRIKASNNDGIWNEKGTSVNITILPPWWKTVWFKLLMLLILVLSIYIAYYVRLDLYRKKQKELTLLVKKRTQEITQANEILLERQSRIEEYAEELRTHTENLREANDLLIDKQKLIEIQAEQLKDTNQQLSILNSTKDRFFSIIAHDLRNPFHAISGFAEVLLKDFDKLQSENIQKTIQLMQISSTSGSYLLENLLQWSRSQTGRISYKPNKLNLATVANENINLLEGDAQRKNITIQSLIDPNIMVFADENMLKTIFRNLISNAIKFTHEKGNIIITSAITDLMVEVTVADTGVGIPQETLSLLFRIDTTVATKGTLNEPGTGLGLILCKEFVEKHNGKIWVECEVSKGSKFKFTLPLG